MLKNMCILMRLKKLIEPEYIRVILNDDLLNISLCMKLIFNELSMIDWNPKPVK